MQKRCMLNLMAGVAFLILAPILDAAPIASEAPEHQQVSLRGDKKLTDPWTSGPYSHDMTYLDKQKMTVSVGSSASLDKATSSPHYLDKMLAATNSQGGSLRITLLPFDSDGLENTLSSTNRLDSQLNLGSLMDDPKIEEYDAMEESSEYKPVTVHSNKPSQTSLGIKGGAINSASSTADGQEKILHMLIALEELQKTLKSRLTLITRGNTNSRSSGKKSKMIPEGNLKSTTVSSVLSKGAFTRASTDQIDPKHLNGKAFKKALPATPKKTNKRVCFWKYCSQN